MEIEVRNIQNKIIELTVETHDCKTQETLSKQECKELAVELLDVVRELIEFSNDSNA